MSIQKSTKTFFEATNHSLSNVSELNLFPIMYDSVEREEFLNIFRNYIINEDAKQSMVFYNTHEVDDTDWWDTIAYKYYNNQYLWWVTAYMNNVMNPFEDLEPGTNVKILKSDYIYQLLKEMMIVGNM
jgi:hypothetical protein